MIYVHYLSGDHIALAELTARDTLPEGAVWVDVVSPSAEEERLVEQATDITLPTRGEMQEIENSSRLYTDDHTKYMTTTVLRQDESGKPERIEVTFIYRPEMLVTLRYEGLHPFRILSHYAQRSGRTYTSPEATLLGLLNAIVERTADILESVQGELLKVSQQVFDGVHPAQHGITQPSFESELKRLGVQQGYASNAQQSLHALQRLIRFLSSSEEPTVDTRSKERLRILTSDTATLREYTHFLINDITFLQEATLGMINIEQNNIIKIFSVAAVVFLPPTLIASIYGMNFRFMPELNWPWGYPMAVLLMVLSAFLSYWWFKKRGLL